jgi:hypothetical protein
MHVRLGRIKSRTAAALLQSRAAEAACLQIRMAVRPCLQVKPWLAVQDAEMDRLQQRFASHLEKEDRRAKADKAAYERLKRAYAASKGW